MEGKREGEASLQPKRPVWDPPVGTLGRGSAGQNAEGAEPRVERCPYAFFRGRETRSWSGVRLLPVGRYFFLSSTFGSCMGREPEPPELFEFFITFSVSFSDLKMTSNFFLTERQENRRNFY
jgi:hypothetical protein